MPRGHTPTASTAPASPLRTARAVPVAAIAHLLLIDQTGQILLRQVANGLWGLPSTVLGFTIAPHLHVARFARRELEIEVAERDLLLAHVSAHRATAHAALRLVFSVGHWHGDPAHDTRCQWAAPDTPPRLGPWDTEILPALLTITPYTEIGWPPPDSPTLPGRSS
ncbi:hypothetical protein AB1484_35435 [Parafrankia sp. FMc6]|uniref:hypothetical protein n=1 Tax=Parafrankia soli TaxID=2599596 RepID=UPI0034D6F508